MTNNKLYLPLFKDQKENYFVFPQVYFTKKGAAVKRGLQYPFSYMSNVTFVGVHEYERGTNVPQVTARIIVGEKKYNVSFLQGPFFEKIRREQE